MLRQCQGRPAGRVCLGRSLQINTRREALSSRGGRGQVLLQPAPPTRPYQTRGDKDNLLGSAFLLSPTALRAARADLGRVAQAGTKGTLWAHRGRAFWSAVRASLCPSPHPVSLARAVGSRPRPCQHGAPAGRDDEPGSVTNLAEADHAPRGPSSPPLSKASEPGAQPPARWPQVGLDPSIQSQAGRDHEAIKSSYLTAASMEYSWARDPTSLCPCRMGC